jgi:hypothetical protein
METNPGLAALRRPTEYRSERTRIFPSDGSFEWYSRTHREQLVEAGAMIRVGGKWFVHAPRFDAFVLNGGRAG